MEISITKESAIVLAGVYKTYCAKKKSGLSHNQAASFMLWDELDKCTKELSSQGISRCINELARFGLVKAYAIDYVLTDYGIATVEKNCSGGENIQKWIDTLVSVATTVISLVSG